MPRQKRDSLPKLRRDRNIAFCEHNGRRYHFGRWNSPEAKEAYKRFRITILEGEAPVSVKKKRAEAILSPLDTAVTVAELVEQYFTYLENKGVNDKRERPHTYREVEQVKGIHDVHDFDSPIPDLSVSFSLKHVNLTPYAGAIEVGADTARMIGNHKAYFVEQARLVARDLGQKLEKSIFERIVRTSVDTNRRWSMFDSATPQEQNTLVAVTWQSKECCGLYGDVCRGV